VEGAAEALLLPAIAEMIGRDFSVHGVSVVNVGDVGLYHYARIFQRIANDEAIPMPVACITDRDIVPDIAQSFVAKPKTGKRFESDYTATEASDAVKRKRDRVELASNSFVRVFVSDQWTLEFDLVFAGLGDLMFVAILLGQKQASKGERLTDADEATVIAGSASAWTAIAAKHTDPQALATEIYQPLYDRQASKAVTAQYAAKLLRSGKYGKGKVLFDKLPLYLKNALAHLTGAM
jgi:putative ATP-dependent endonuclease of OLD family